MKRTKLKLPKIKCDFALIDITTGRKELARLIASGHKVPFAMVGYLQGSKASVGHDDGTSIEFAADITKAIFEQPVFVPADTLGRPWAILRELRPGDEIELDRGFTCVKYPKPPRQKRVRVHRDGGGLYFECKDGKHYLEGQLGDYGELIGVYHLKRKK